MFSFELDLIIVSYLNPAIVILLCIKNYCMRPPCTVSTIYTCIH